MTVLIDNISEVSGAANIGSGFEIRFLDEASEVSGDVYPVPWYGASVPSDREYTVDTQSVQKRQFLVDQFGDFVRTALRKHGLTAAQAREFISLLGVSVSIRKSVEMATVLRRIWMQELGIGTEEIDEKCKSTSDIRLDEELEDLVALHRIEVMNSSR